MYNSLIHEALSRIAAWRDLNAYKCNCEEEHGITCGACADMEKVDQALEAMENPSSASLLYPMSTNYDKLYEAICNGFEAFCLVDFSGGSGATLRDIARVRRFGEWDIQISARGIGYGQISSYSKKYFESELEAFKKECKSINLEWAIPFIPDLNAHYTAILVNALKLSNDDMARLVKDLAERRRNYQKL